ncbi:MAG: 5'-nucleotidase C-terminal domain-containing protein [Acidobacteria bacterium]|nr:5'-nucleotidase C-terminal domain-containing protein [Acidobacteriota bacterium]
MPVLRPLQRSARFALALLFAASLCGQGASQRVIRVTLLQLNDVYQTAPGDKGTRGGLARVATLRKKIAAESPHTLLILAGDTISPSTASNLFKGRQMIAAWNAVGLDYAALGNHEFDFGDTVLRERIQESGFVWLAANVIDRNTGRPFGDTPPYAIRNFDGIKIGFFGLLTPDTARNSKPSQEVEFRDPLQTAAQLVPKIRALGAKVVVAITHLSMSQDKELARAAPIDLILGGHEHTLLQSLSGRTPIFKVGSDARNLGRIDLNISSDSGALQSIDWEIIPVTSDVPEDTGAAEIIREYEKEVSATMGKPVGQTSVELDARTITNGSGETNLGSFIADTYRKATGADVALVNGGSIRSNTAFGPGILTQGDILSILPFENPMVKVEVSGAVLRVALEHGLGRVAEHKENGRFPQVSGLRYVFDPHHPPGSRLIRVTVGDKPLDEEKTYTLATSAFVLGGGDGYTMFGNSRVLIRPEDAEVDSSVFMNVVAFNSPIAPRADGRIQKLDEPPARK